MTLRFLKVRTCGYRQVGLTISIKAVFFSVLRPAFLQRFHLRRSDQTKTTKRQYKSSNRNIRRSLLCVPVADRAPHRRQPDASGETNLFEHSIQPIAEGDYLVPRDLWLPLLPQGLDHFGKPRAAGIARRHLLDSLADLSRRMHSYSRSNGYNRAALLTK